IRVGAEDKLSTPQSLTRTQSASPPGSNQTAARFTSRNYAGWRTHGITSSPGGHLMKIIGLTAIELGVFLVQAQANHSSSMFAKEKMITVSGTLKEFEWSNPNSWLHIVAVDHATGHNVE